MNITYASEHGAFIAFEDGEQHANFDAEAAKHILGAQEIEIQINFKAGSQSASGWGCDMEYDPIRTSRRRQSATEHGGTGSAKASQEFAGVG
jgi:glutamate N-acetyltransferase/amino-acid N-acetyltransferase